MTEIEALEIITDIVKSIKNVAEVNIERTTNLAKDGLLDSLDHMLFFMELTEKYGINLPDENLIKDGYYNNVDKLIKTIISLSKNGQTKI